jgi:hypothetical protein
MKRYYISLPLATACILTEKQSSVVTKYSETRMCVPVYYPKNLEAMSEKTKPFSNQEAFLPDDML